MTLAEAALANAQLIVAKAVLKAEFRRKSATVEGAAAEARYCRPLGQRLASCQRKLLDTLRVR